MPIFFPSRRSSPPRCPHCRREESTRTTCRHCGYEYADDDERIWPFVVAIVLGVVVALPVLFSGIGTTMCWIDPGLGYDCASFEHPRNGRVTLMDCGRCTVSKWTNTLGRVW